MEVRDRDHHGVERDPTMDHRIVHNVCVSNKKEQVHLKDKERYLQNAFDVQQHIIRREEKGLLKHLQKLKMEKHMRHPEIRMDSNHCHYHDVDHPDKTMLHFKGHQLHQNSSAYISHTSTHHPRSSYPSNANLHSSNFSDSHRYHHADEHTSQFHGHQHESHHWHGHHHHHDELDNHHHAFDHHYHVYDHHHHVRDHSHPTKQLHHFHDSSRNVGVQGNSSFRSHRSHLSPQSSGYLPHIHHAHHSHHSEHFHPDHHDEDYSDIGAINHHDSYQSVPGYMKPKHGDHHRTHHHDEFISLVESCVCPKQPAGYGHSTKDCGSRRRSLPGHYKYHGTSIWSFQSQPSKRRHSVDFNTAKNFRPVGTLHLMNHLTPSFHDRLSHHLHQHSHTSSRRGSFQTFGDFTDSSNHEPPTATGTQGRSVSEETGLMAPTFARKKSSSMEIVNKKSSKEADLANREQTKGKLMPHAPEDVRKKLPITRTLNVTMKIKRGAVKKTPHVKPLADDKAERKSKEASDLILEDVSPPKSPEYHRQAAAIIGPKQDQAGVTKSSVHPPGGNTQLEEHEKDSSHLKITRSSHGDVAAETIAELQALSASAAQGFAPVTGVQSRKTRFRQLAKELLMHKLPMISRQRQLAEFDPLEMLQCRYLRLSKNNVEELVDLCQKAGVPIDIHPHMTIEDVTQEVFGKLDDHVDVGKKPSTHKVPS